MAPPLLSPSFLRELEVLRRRLLVRTRSGESGARVARRRGSSAEFLEHRGYAPGDDWARLDWAALARTLQPVTKLFRAEEDTVVRLLFDGSASLGFGEPTKFEVAKRLGAAIGYVALAGSERAQFFLGQANGPSGGLGRVGPPRRGRAGFASLVREIGDAQAGGSCDLGRAIELLARRSVRPGLLVVLSDFFDAGPVLRGLNRASSQGHDVALAQILCPSEIEPDFEGDLGLVDCESEARVDLSVDQGSIEAYQRRLVELVESLRAWARDHRASYLRTTTREPMARAVKRLITRAID